MGKGKSKGKDKVVEDTTKYEIKTVLSKSVQTFKQDGHLYICVKDTVSPFFTFSKGNFHRIVDKGLSGLPKDERKAAKDIRSNKTFVTPKLLRYMIFLNPEKVLDQEEVLKQLQLFSDDETVSETPQG